MVWFSNDVVKANIKGDGLIKAWREYKGMFQEKLAKKADGKKPSVLARMEKTGANPRTISRIGCWDMYRKE
jgi:ribosome-binding protein aMBF1 (putative translation factor)